MSVLEERLANLSPAQRALLERKLFERKSQEEAGSAISRRNPIDPIPLSQTQESLRFLDQLTGDEAPYNESISLDLRGPLNVDAVRQTLAAIAARHEILRTTFPVKDGRPVQQIAPSCDVCLPIIETTEEQAASLAADQSRKPFDLKTEISWRATLLRLGPMRHVLLLTMHHILCDGWSFGLLLGEFEVIYGAISRGEPSTLRELPAQFADFAQWQRRHLDSRALASQLEYWKQHLAEAPALEFPTDHPRPAAQTYRGAKKRFTISSEVAQALRELGRREGATLYMTLLAAFNVLLHRYTSQEDILVGSPATSRKRVETESLIGPLINTLVLRTDLSGNPDFVELLGRVKRNALAAYANQDVPFEMLVRELRPDRDPSRSPLFQVMFSFESWPAPPRIRGGETAIELVDNGTSKFDLTLIVLETQLGTAGVFEYNTDLLDAGTIDRIERHFKFLLGEIIRNPRCKLSDLDVLSVDERRQLTMGNYRRTEYPALPVHELFRAQAGRTPDAIALAHRESKLTYRELNERSDLLAGALQAVGVGNNALVGICVDRSLDMVTGVLAILKAGGAYVPLDPLFPKHRLAMMLEDANPRVLLTQTHLVNDLPEHAAKVVCTDVETDATPYHPVTVSAVDLMYVLFTSGSTGRPKGAQITHRAMVNFLTSMAEEPGLTSSDVLLAVTTLSFDIAGLEIFLPLLTGACVVIADRETVSSGHALATAMEKCHCTAMQATPVTWRILIQSGWRGSRSLKILCGGEAMPQDLADQLLSRCASLWNLYGPTETTVWSTLYRVVAHRDPVPVGRPIANTSIYILDRNLRPVPAGVAGELWIGGDGLSAGYLNRPELTAEKFVPDPFCDKPGARMYRTGDRARYLSDGNVEYLGRLDQQVKVRGFRIELGEIESALRAHPAIAEAAAGVRQDASGEASLVAWLVCANGSRPASQELRTALECSLPPYMIPGHFVTLDALPLTPNGKVDRKALAPPFNSMRAENGNVPSVKPSNPTEALIAGVWADVLGIPEPGIRENFFDLGGHSLKATQVISRIREIFGVEITFHQFFKTPNIAGLAAALCEAQTATRPAVARRQTNGDCELSYSQQRLWFVSQLRPDSPMYNSPVAIRMRGELDIAALRMSIDHIVNRHEALRTAFPMSDGQPLQRIVPKVELGLPVVDITKFPKRQRASEEERLIHDVSRRPFNLAEAPLVRALLIRHTENDYTLALTMHHIVCDGWSFGIFFRELEALYRAFTNSQAPGLPELPCQYVDFSEWQKNWLESGELEAQLRYWKAQLQDIPPALELLSDRPRQANKTFRGATRPIQLSAELTEALQALGQREGATLFMVLLAAFQVLLHRYTGQDDILVGSPTANRQRMEFESLIGVFINKLVLRGDLSGDPSFAEFLRRVRKIALEAYAHQDLPFERLVDELQPNRDASHTPLFQVLFVLQNAPWTSIQLPSLEVKVAEIESGAAKFDLVLALSDSGQGLCGSIEYDTDLFDAETIDRLSSHFQVLLAGIAEHPSQRISEFPLLAEAERQVLDHWNVKATPYPKDLCIHQLFESQVKRTPDATAIVFEDTRMTYRELNEMANRLAHYLRKAGIGPDTLVGICMDRSLQVMVGLLGILKAGGAYVPLDPSYPRERLAYMIADSGVPIIITQESLLPSLPDLTGTAGRILCLDAEWERIASESCVNPVNQTGPDNLAYLIYTSGSTGIPKGAEIPHTGVVRLVCGADYVRFGPAEVYLQLSTLSFDASTFEIWGALLHGARCVLFPDRTPDFEKLGKVIREHRITTLWLTAALFNSIIDEAPHALKGIRQLLTGGEALSVSHVSRALRLLPGTHLVNGYGPTESATFAACYPIRDNVDGMSSVPIGRPIANTSIHLLDCHRNPVPIGVPGELYIGGAGLARGYHNAAALTQEKFVPNPFSPEERLYRTGDLARYRSDGDIEFLGRIDTQVKLRGFRIELGEVETVLTRHPAVRQAVVLIREDVAGSKYLAAYVVPAQGQHLDLEDVRRFLQRQLPEYMLPSAFVPLESMPITVNGKVNRSALPVPEMRSNVTEIVAGRDQIETQLIVIWRRLLGMQSVGIRESFFNLGGNSLMAVRLIARIHRVFRKNIPVSALFQAPTIEQLAELIRRDRDAAAPSAVYQIQPGSSAPPLFCVHPDTEFPYRYAALASRLGSERPVYGVEPFCRNKAEGLATVAEIAAATLEEIRSIQPEGPYALLGFCFGGLLALEIAQQLKRENQDVSLFMIDTVGPDYPQRQGAQHKVNLFLHRIRYHCQKLKSLSLSQRFAYLGTSVGNRAVRIRRTSWQCAYKACRAIGLGIPKALRNRTQEFVLQGMNYRPTPYAGSVILFRPSDPGADGCLDPQLGWGSSITGGVEAFVVPGDHLGMLAEQNVEAMAEIVRPRLAESGQNEQKPALRATG